MIYMYTQTLMNMTTWITDKEPYLYSSIGGGKLNSNYSTAGNMYGNLGPFYSPDTAHLVEFKYL